MMSNENVIGILFNNGVQVVARLVKEDDKFMYVENMLALQLRADVDESGNPVLGADGQPMSKLFFDNYLDFAENTKTGIDTRIPWSSVTFPFPVESRILHGYVQRTSLIKLV
jgi:hypothetical protein